MNKFSEFISESESATISYDELVKDYKDVEYCENKEKKALAAKYECPAKIKEIQKAILLKLRDERNNKNSYTEDDITWFGRLSDYPERYANLAKFLTDEKRSFVEFMKDKFESYLKSKKVKNGKTLFDLKGIASSRDFNYYMSYSDKYQIMKYLNISKFLGETSDEGVAKKNTIQSIVSKLNEQMVDFKKMYLERIKKDAEQRYDEAPQILEKLNKSLEKYSKKIEDFRDKWEGSNWGMYSNSDYKALERTYNGIRGDIAEVKSVLSLTKDKFVQKNVDNGEKVFNNNIQALAERINERKFNIDALKISKVGDDDKFFTMMISDGNITMYARSIIAAQYSDKVMTHLRFIITNRPDGKTDQERFDDWYNNVK